MLVPSWRSREERDSSCRRCERSASRAVPRMRPRQLAAAPGSWFLVVRRSRARDIDGDLGRGSQIHLHPAESVRWRAPSRRGFAEVVLGQARSDQVVTMRRAPVAQSPAENVGPPSQVIDKAAPAPVQILRRVARRFLLDAGRCAGSRTNRPSRRRLCRPASGMATHAGRVTVGLLVLAP